MGTASAATERISGSRVATWPQRQPPSPLTSDEHQPFRAPLDEKDCDAMLASAEFRVKYLPERVRQELLADLSRFLGATSRIWTRERRRRLDALLVNDGLLSVVPVLRSVEATPREEVIDQAVAILAGIVERHEGAAFAFAETLTPPPSGIATAQIARETMLRALVRARCPASAQVKLNIAYKLATQDPAPAVRDAAVQALSTIGRRDGAAIVLDLLGRLKSTEQDRLVLESIDEAIETVRGQ